MDHSDTPRQQEKRGPSNTDRENTTKDQLKFLINESLKSKLNKILFFLYYWKEYKKNIWENINLNYDFSIDFLEFLQNWWLDDKFPWISINQTEVSKLKTAQINIMRDIFKWQLLSQLFWILISRNSLWMKMSETFNASFSWSSNLEQDHLCWIYNKIRSKIPYVIMNLWTWTITLKNDKDLSLEDIVTNQSHSITLLSNKNSWPFKAWIDINTNVGSGSLLWNKLFLSHELFMFTDKKITSIPKQYSDDPEFCEIFEYKPWDKNWNQVTLSNDWSELTVKSIQWNKLIVRKYLLLAQKFESEKTSCSKYVYYMSWISSYNKPQWGIGKRKRFRIFGKYKNPVLHSI